MLEGVGQMIKNNQKTKPDLSLMFVLGILPLDKSFFLPLKWHLPVVCQALTNVLKLCLFIFTTIFLNDFANDFDFPP